MFGKGKRSPSSSLSLTLHSTHLARRRSPFGMALALEEASDGLSSALCCGRAHGHFLWERAVAGWRPDACGQRPHRARQGALRGTARSARRDGRSGPPRHLMTTAFQLTSGEVHIWCTGLDVPPETSARLYATLAPDERNRCARF